MINGWVNAFHDLVVPLVVRDPAGRDTRFEFIIDTGYTGTLTLPRSAITTLNLTFATSAEMVLGDGSRVMFDIYEAVVLWDGTSQNTWVRAVDTLPLLGLGLLAGHDLRARIEDGGTVEIEAIP